MKYKAYLVRSNRSIFGKLIRLFSRGKWDHVMFSNGSNVVEIQTDGVKIWDFAGYTNINTIAELDLPELHGFQVMQWYAENAQVKYDWIRTLMWPFRRLFKSNSSKRLNCVEMLRDVYLRWGIVSFEKENFSPDELETVVGLK